MEDHISFLNKTLYNNDIVKGEGVRKKTHLDMNLKTLNLMKIYNRCIMKAMKPHILFQFEF